MKPIKNAELKLIELDPDEQIYGESRRHFIGVYLILAGAAILFVMLLVMLYVVISNENSLQESLGFGASFNLGNWMTAVVMIVSIMILIGTAMSLYVYRKNYLVLTSEKLVIVRTFSIVRRKISQLSIGDIQDVTVEQNTLFSRMFRYGTLNIETSGEQANLKMNYMIEPFEVSKDIIRSHEADLKLHGN